MPIACVSNNNSWSQRACSSFMTSVIIHSLTAYIYKCTKAHTETLAIWLTWKAHIPLAAIVLVWVHFDFSTHQGNFIRVKEKRTRDEDGESVFMSCSTPLFPFLVVVVVVTTDASTESFSNVCSLLLDRELLNNLLIFMWTPDL